MIRKFFIKNYNFLYNYIKSKTRIFYKKIKKIIFFKIKKYNIILTMKIQNFILILPIILQLVFSQISLEEKSLKFLNSYA